MSTTTKLPAGAVFPAMSWLQVGGGTVDPWKAQGWRMLVVYRGKHCRLCKQYFKTSTHCSMNSGRPISQ